MSRSKTRGPIPADLSSEVLFASDRICCVCQVRGKRIQIHHIDEDSSNNAFENLAVLCFDCHDETHVRGGFGRRLDASLVARFRRDWLERVRARHVEADRLVSKAGAIGLQAPKVGGGLSGPPALPTRTGLIPYVRTLPELRRLALEAAREGWESGVTAEMVAASYGVIDALVAALVKLASYYPPDHFERENPRDYFSELVGTRFRWHRYHHSTGAEGYSGTIVAPLTTADVTRDVERMIEDTVASLLFVELTEERFDYQAWLADWRRAGETADEGA